MCAVSVASFASNLRSVSYRYAAASVWYEPPTGVTVDEHQLRIDRVGGRQVAGAGVRLRHRTCTPHGEDYWSSWRRHRATGGFR
jgi:hypothetical protein